MFPDALTTGGSVRSRPPDRAASTPPRNADAATRIGDSKATVGPNLAGVGSRLTRQQLLESLITPSARIAPGYGQVSVTLRNGQKIEGMLVEESTTMIAIDDATQGLQNIPVANIATRTNGVVGDAADEPAADAA